MFWDYSAAELRCNDNAAIFLGSNKDAFLAHDGSSTRLQDNYGHFFIGGNLIQIKSGNLSKEFIRMNSTDNTVKLYFNTTEQLSTVGYGITVFGTTETQKLNVTGISTFADVVGFSSDINVTGISTFNDEVNVVQGKKINFGNTNGTTGHIYYDGSTTRFQTNQGLNIGAPVISLKGAGLVGVMGEFIQNGAVQLYHNNLLRLETDANGVQIKPNVGGVTQLGIAQTTTTAYSINGTISFINSSNTTAQIRGRTGSASTTGDIIFLCNTVGDETLAVLEDGKVRVPDSGMFVAGTGNDLQIYHSNSDNHSYIKESGSGDLLIQATQIKLQDASGTDYLRGFTGGAVYLHNAGNNKFETTSTGVHVTGEVSASQDYPTTQPTLDLNFAAEKKLDPRITYIRTGPASYVNKLGEVVLVGDNEPRFDYGYELLAGNTYTIGKTGSKGLLIEEERVNLFKQSIYKSVDGRVQTSGTVNNWGLLFTTGGSASFTPGIDAPDGSNNAVRFTNNNTGFTILRLNVDAFTPNGSDYYTLSFYVRSISGTGGMSCDLADAAPQGTWSADLVTNEWVRIVKTGVPSNASKTFIDIMSNADNNRVFDIWGVQLEKGSFATSFIPTDGSNATRGADLVEITEEEFSEFYNRTEGSFVSEIMIKPSYPVTGYASYMMTLSDASFNNRVTLSSSTGSAAFNADVNIGGTLTRAALGSYTSGSHSIKAAIAYKAADTAGSLNGAAAVTSSPGTLPLLTRADIGKDHQNNNLLNGHIKRIMYYSKRLPNNQLRTLTA